MEIGTLIKNKRIEKQMTMKQLADLMEVSEGTVSRWESGDIENIKRKKMVKLSNILDISIYTIMGLPESNNKSINNELRTDETQLLSLYNELDSEDKAELRGTAKGMLKADKYTLREKNAI